MQPAHQKGNTSLKSPASIVPRQDRRIRVRPNEEHARERVGPGIVDKESRCKGRQEGKQLVQVEYEGKWFVQHPSQDNQDTVRFLSMDNSYTVIGFGTHGFTTKARCYTKKGEREVRKGSVNDSRRLKRRCAATLPATRAWMTLYRLSFREHAQGWEER